MTRYASTQQRRDAWARQGGLCAWCEQSLGHDHDADHIVPWSRGGLTETGNIQLLHSRPEVADDCHAQKSRIYDALRDWQQEFCDVLHAHDEQTFLLQAGTGAGKTEAGIAAFERWRIGKRKPLLVILAPSVQILRGWAEHCVVRGPTGVVNLDRREREIRVGSRSYELLLIDSGPADDDFALLLTYQSLAGMSNVLRALCRERDVCVILDEIHHVESTDAATWGPSAEVGFASAGKILGLSATPFRSNRTPISFLTYEGGFARVDYEFSPEESIRACYTVPAHFRHLDGRSEWRDINLDDPEETIENVPGVTGRISDQRTADRALNVALGDLDFCMELAEGGRAALREEQEIDPRAKGLVVARDQAMARRIASALNEIRQGSAVVATSDDVNAHRTIELFKRQETDADWLVSVAMVSEGCNIPWLKVLVYATLARTRVSFVQLVGRVNRSVGPDMTAQVVMPAHPVLAQMAREILRMQPIRVADEDEAESEPGAAAERTTFTVGMGVDDILMSAITAGGESIPIEERLRRVAEAHGIPLDRAALFARELGLIVRGPELRPEPVLAGVREGGGHATKSALRDEANAAVRRIAFRRGFQHNHIWTEARDRGGLPTLSLSQYSERQLRTLVQVLHQMGGAREQRR